MSRFSCVEAAPPVEIFALMRAYRADAFPQKVDLGVGAYRTEEAKPWVLPVVRKVEKEMAEDSSLNHEYLGQLGLDDFSKAAVSMLLGSENQAIKDGRAVGVQCLSGTGSLRVGADMLCKHAKFTTVYMSTPTWPNHALVFKHAGFQNIKYYHYWDAKNRCLDFNAMIEDLQNAPEDSVVVLHACAHNPTGIDPTQDQWMKIADIMKAKKLFPFFDCAYQGFASGNLENDSWAIRYFVSQGFELVCAQSFAKNFGLYNERIGNLLLVIDDKEALTNVLAQITLLVRGNYSNPPNHGARIVSKVLNTPAYFEEWKSHIQTMANRIISMRKALQDKLHELGTPGSWEHITKQIGMFSYTGLNQQQVQHLVQNYHVYLPKDGRISICGLNTGNVEYVAKAIHDAVTKFPQS
ncbi:aspartate aminotransferase, cytoplasmic isoform X1 [Dermacentor andersoni]|uniref:aspartate aminotransferase, cytoplasmic isoform X1 n=2 Tax=Dermacentor andersoni TaxID=34620 RepID=UPI00215502B4|nr:aspartate aminotransferase, cytoplasmic-like isoform X1 [Dermacentor andersoni]